MECNKLWEKNIEALEAMLPGWGTYLKGKKYQIKNNKCVKVTYSQTKEKIFLIENNEKDYYLGGKYNPAQTAKYFSKTVKNGGYGSVVFFVGFSDGRVIQNAIKKIDKDATILVYEPCIQIFVKAMEEMDLGRLFQQRTLGLIIDGINGNELEDIIEKSISVENMTKLQIIIQGNYKLLFPEEVRNVVHKIRKHIDDIRVWWITNIEFTNETGKNLITNFKYLYNHYSLNEMYGKLPDGTTAIIVAAGPSLDKNIDELKAAMGHACIIACDTALKPLLKRGIIPDFFVVVDPRKPLELFDEPEIKDIPMISGLNIPVEIMKLHRAEKIFYYDTPLMTDMLNEVLDKPIENNRCITPVPTGGSVATNAFSVARLMGAKTIVLVGQDLALSGEKEHATGTFQNDRKFDRNDKNLPLVEGINGEMLPTLDNLKIYLQWFEEQIKIYPDIKVIDATEGGALIHGSKVMTLKETITLECTGSFDSRYMLNNAKKHFSDVEKERAVQYFSKLPRRLEYVRNMAQKGIADYRKLEKSANAKKLDGNNIKKIIKRIEKVNKFIEEDPLAYMMTESLRGVEYTLRAGMYQDKQDEREEIRESAKMGYFFLKTMVRAVDEMMPLYKELAEYKGD